MYTSDINVVKNIILLKMADMSTHIHSLFLICCFVWSGSQRGEEYFAGDMVPLKQLHRYVFLSYVSLLYTKHLPIAKSNLLYTN